MRRFLLLFTILIFTLCVRLSAKGVSAGTKIYNSASLTYKVLDKEHTLTSNTLIDTVSQLISVDVSSLDISYKSVNSGKENHLLTFQVTNTGNGLDHFELQAVNSLNNDFQVKSLKIFLDENNNSKLDINDPLINAIHLQADESVALFVTSNIPDNSNLKINDTAQVSLIARSKLGGSGKPGMVFTGAGVNQINIIDGMKGGIDSASGTYKVKNFDLILKKGAVVTNGFGTNEPVTGAMVTYEINVTAIGTGIAQDVNISDKLPDEVEYQVNSITLDNINLSDIDDSDKGYFDAVNNTLYIAIGNMQSGENHRIKFNTLIK